MPSQQAMNELRRSLRICRRNLSQREQHQASLAACRLIARHPLFHRSRHIAFYHAVDGEIDPSPLLRIALQRNKRCYLPVLTYDNRLSFARYRMDTTLRGNRFGIPEPVNTPVLPAWALQLVITPLVAFDQEGWRLGMGGGYYDRSFAFKQRSQKRTPVLLGMAYSFQQVPKLHNARWDIPLQGVVTEKNCEFFRDRGQI